MYIVSKIQSKFNATEETHKTIQWCITSQLVYSCLMLTMETPEQCVKSVQS